VADGVQDTEGTQLCNAACQACNSGSCTDHDDTEWGSDLGACTGVNRRCLDGDCIACGGWMNGGYCWYQGGTGMTCFDTCAAHGGTYGTECDWIDDPDDCSTCLHWHPGATCRGPYACTSFYNSITGGDGCYYTSRSCDEIGGCFFLCDPPSYCVSQCACNS
jgi:hypothetical protein